MMFDLSDKSAVVLGGAGYLGTSVCAGLARQGASVLIADYKEDALASSAAAVLATAAHGTRVETFRADAREENAVRDTVGRARTRFGRLDIAVFMAYRSIGKKVEDLEPAEFDEANHLNITAAFLFAREAAARMTEGGSIILFSSMYGHLSPDPKLYAPPMNPNPVEYGAGKAATDQLVRYLAVHYAPKGIRVNGIAPGPFPYPSIQHNEPEFVHRLNRKTPLGRVGQAAEMAGPVAFLASAEASYVTGHILNVDGGWSAW